MGINTEISWCDHTFNPWWGCVKVSPACDECYAERDAKRYGHAIWGKDAPRRFFGDTHWDTPLKWDRSAAKDGVRRRVFCASMADVMENRMDLDTHRIRLWSLIKATPNLDWLLLSKRPQEFRKMLPWGRDEYAPDNVWLGTTVESPDYYWRIGELTTAPAKVHFLSVEPLLAAMPELRMYLDHVEWVIAGGESGGLGIRPMSLDWARQVRDAAVSRSIPFHFKQWGEHNSELVRIGKKKAGSELDGREWKEFPR